MWRAVAITSALLGSLTGGGQWPAVRSVMQEKLTHTQQILGAMVTGDWVALEMHSRELEQLTGDPRWEVLKYPEYTRHSDAFVRSVRALHTAAVRRERDRAPKAFNAVVSQCVECHQYLARVRTTD